MRIASGLIVIGLSVAPQTVQAQFQTDCNQLAREFVVKRYQAGWSSYSQYLFFSLLTQVDVEKGKEALKHSGEVAFGPLKIGPGTWDRDKQNELRKELTKVVSIENLNQSAAAVTISSGDSEAARSVDACITVNGVAHGGLFGTLKDYGKDTAAFDIMWAAPPGGVVKQPPTIKSVSIINGRVVGGDDNKGAPLPDRLMQAIVIERSDPLKDLTVIVNTEGAGRVAGYLPPSALPPTPDMVRVPIESVSSPTAPSPVEVGSGGKYEGGRNPCPGSNRSKEICVYPQHGGKLVKGSGKPRKITHNGNVGTSDAKETEDSYCVTFWAATQACEAENLIVGVATAVEEYPKAAAPNPAPTPPAPAAASSPAPSQTGKK